MLLELKDLQVHYGGIRAVKGIDLQINEGELVCLIGANGAGKSTTLKAICGLAAVHAGSVRYDGSEISRARVHELPRRGLVLVPEGRGIFPQLTVQENLAMGAYALGGGRIEQMSEPLYASFPRLKERRHQTAGTLSGGEQQMLAIGRCLMGAPELVMFDEPSLGLAPAIVHQVLQTIRDLNAQGLTCVLVEQNVAVSLKLASRAYVLENGRITLSGSGAELLADDRVRQAYLGM